MQHIKLYFLGLVFFVFATSNAQTTIPVIKAKDKNINIGFGATKNIIKLDPLTRLPVGNIPFDRTFILRVYFDQNTDQDITSFYLYDKKDKKDPIKKLSYYLLRSASDVTKYDKTDEALVSFPHAIDIVIPPLYPNHDYQLRFSSLAFTDQVKDQYLKVFMLLFQGNNAAAAQLQQNYKTANGNDQGIPTNGYVQQYYTNNNLKSIYDNYGGDSSKANVHILAFMKANNQLNISGIGLVNDFFNSADESYQALVTVTTYVYTIQSSSKLRIVADGGVIYTGWQKNFTSFTSYAGINVSLRPMDTEIPFRLLVRNKRIKFYQRFTLNLGITLNTLAKDNYRANLFSNNNIMIGLGYKLSHVLNVNFGGLLYNNIDPNPLNAKKTLGVAPYAGLSINLLIKDALGDIAKIFTYAK
jgi:hypothetical protein